MRGVGVLIREYLDALEQGTVEGRNQE